MTEPRWIEGRTSLVISFVVLATSFGFAVPAWEAPDEVAHMRYVEHLLARRSLPVQHRDRFGEEHQAPLYYALAAAAVAGVDRSDPLGAFRWNRRFGWEPGADVNMAHHAPGERFAFRGRALALRIVRLLSTGLAAGTVILTMMLAAVVGARSAVVLLAGSLVAFNPQFVFVSAVVNNDNLQTLCCTGCLLSLARAVRTQMPTRLSTWFAVGGWWSAALLAKLSALTFAPVIAAALALRWWHGDSGNALVRAAMAVGSVVTLVVGWWFVRNQWLYGDPLGLGPFRTMFGPDDALGPSALPAALLTQFQSFWGWFGWMSVPAPQWFYVLVGTLTLAALVGLGRATFGHAARPRSDRAVDAVLVLALAVVVHEAFQLRAILTFGRSWMQGRYLFPIFPAASVLAALGLSNLVSSRRLPLLAAGVSTVLVLCTVYLLVAVVLPAYGPA